MGITKKDLFNKDTNAIANFGRVLGHPARVAILNHLIKISGCCCSDLVEELGLAQATISQHLKVLKDINLIKGSIEGKSFCYCINKDEWENMQQIFSDFFDFKMIINNKCC